MSAEERSLILDEIKGGDLASIFRAWLESGHVQHDPMKQHDVGWALSLALRKKQPDPEVLRQMQEFLADGANSAFDRAVLIRALGNAATNESVDLLIRTAMTSTDEELKRVACAGIREAGSSIWNGWRRHEELSPALEGMWLGSQDQNLLAAAAFAMAKVGAASAVALLLTSAMTAESGDNVRGQLARSVLSEVRNPSAIPILSGVLGSQPPGSSSSRLAGGTLANMVDPAAAKALLSWLQSADESASELAYGYVVRSRTPAQLATWDSALNQALPFRSEKVRASIQAGLVEYHKNH